MFSWIDFTILILVLGISSVIGIYHGYFGTKQATMSEYLLAGKTVGIFPIAISVAIGHVSAITLMGTVADVYKYGAFYWYSCISVILLSLTAAFVFYPKLYKLQMTSTFEYFEMRFDYRTRILGSLFYILSENLMLAVVMYSPALALSVATGFNVHLTCLLLCAVCTFYTAIGGLKSVIWTDLFQFLVVIGSCFVILALGLKKAGGFASVWNISLKGNRLDIFDFDPNPTKKDTVWIIFGLAVRMLYPYCLSQSSMQKYISLPNCSLGIRSILIGGVVLCLLISMSVFLGLIVYANFANCDPVITKKISRIDQILPLFVNKVTGNIPGLSGLFQAALVCASISTLSSSLNSLSSVIYKDFISKMMKNEVSERQSVAILKLIVVTQGIVCLGLTFIIPYIGDILSLAIGLSGLLDGPSIGLFVLGILFKNSTAQGAFYGSIGGMLFEAVIYFPAFYYKSKGIFVYPGKAISVDGCSNETLMMMENFTKIASQKLDSSDEVFFLFRISHNYYCLIGAAATVIFGLIISFCSKEKNENNEDAVTEFLMASNGEKMINCE